VRGAAVSVVGVTFLSAATAGMEAFSGEDITVRYAARYARLPNISPLELNDQAWLIAISADPSRPKLEAALLLAERAVAETNRDEPTILDTLAEVLWQLGNVDAALATIDEAIARDPGSDYYREQRRRFAGERAPDDRPEYVPQWLRVPGADPPPPAPASDPGLSV
jgi:tetratricopeptide (TPR) repeat protein